MNVYFQLGWYVGEYIYARNLPTLSCDMILTNRVIRVLPEEEDRIAKLNALWFKTEDDRFFDRARKEHRDLARKYLPAKLETDVRMLTVPAQEEDVKDLKNGLRQALWDTDVCWYRIEKDEDIELVQEKYWTTVILTLDA
jgi:hypothetical protein